MFLEKDVLKISSKFISEHPCRRVISIKLLCILRHTCSPVNLLQILRTSVPKDTSGVLLLNFIIFSNEWFLAFHFPVISFINCHVFLRSMYFFNKSKSFAQIFFSKLVFIILINSFRFFIHLFKKFNLESLF